MPYGAVGSGPTADTTREPVMAQNTYEATTRPPGGGPEKMRIMATSWAQARDLLAVQYGEDRVMNLHQK